MLNGEQILLRKEKKVRHCDIHSLSIFDLIFFMKGVNHGIAQDGRVAVLTVVRL